jgi:hypothetical protein
MKVHAPDLTPAEDTLAHVLADAIVDDLLGDAGGLWIAVSTHDEADQQQLVERLRAEGRDVRVRREAA